MAKNHICICGKKLSSYHSLWRHKKICKKNQEARPISITQEDKKDRVVSDILNKVVQRADMDTKPFRQPKKHSIPIEAVNNVKPKPLTEIAMKLENKSTPGPSNHESESDSDMEISDSEENESIHPDVEFMPDNPEELKKRFKQLYNKLHHNIDIYNELVFILDELERMNCLTGEECNAMNKCLQEKMGICNGKYEQA